MVARLLRMVPANSAAALAKRARLGVVGPVADMAAVEADDDRILGTGSPFPSAGHPSMDPACSGPRPASQRLATLCRWLRRVEALAVVPPGRTSWSRSAVSPYDTRDANLLSRYSSSGAVCPVNSPASGLKVLASAT